MFNKLLYGTEVLSTMRVLFFIIIIFYSNSSIASKCFVNEDTILENVQFTNVFVGVVTKAYFEEFADLRGGKRAVVEFDLVETLKGTPETLKIVYFVHDAHSIMLGQRHLFVTDSKGFSHICGGSGYLEQFGDSSSAVRNHIYYRLKDKLGK